MAPIDPEVANSNLTPLVYIASHAGIVGSLIFLISRFTYRVHRDTPPALHTRQKHSLHKWGVITFSLLTTISLALATYHALAWRYASYVNWASVSRTDVPGTLWDGWVAHVLQRDREGTVLEKLGVKGWQLGRWMDDTDLVAEANAAGIENAAGFWWTYQNFVGLIIWSIFVGIEGRHRRFPTYITLSFILLAQLASLSSAQNLFFILLSLTPLPLGAGYSEGPVLVPYHSILSIPALISFLALGGLPWSVNHSLFSAVSSLGYFVFPLLLATLAQPNTLHKESKYKSAAAARKSYEDVFRVLALGSIGLHVYFSWKALADTAPPHSYFRHNFVWNKYERAGTSRREQAWAVFIKIISALSENPVISQVGWDVVMSAFSLCVWTVTHGVDVVTMLRCSCLAWTLPRPHVLTVPELNNAKLRAGEALDDLKQEITTTADSYGSPTRRSRGRPRKNSVSATSIAKDHIEGGQTTKRRSTRARTVDDDDEDGEYRPTAATEKQAGSFDVDEASDLGVAKETEAAALGWGLFVLGGLGAVSASVLGAETSGR